MTKSLKALLSSAALAGLLAGTSVGLNAQSSDQKANAGAGTAQQDTKHTKQMKDKHACKGMNSCAGKGGCKTGDNGCKGKNTCKGKGGCRTDGKKPPKQK